VTWYLLAWKPPALSGIPSASHADGLCKRVGSSARLSSSFRNPATFSKRAELRLPGVRWISKRPRCQDSNMFFCVKTVTEVELVISRLSLTQSPHLKDRRSPWRRWNCHQFTRVGLVYQKNPPGCCSLFI